MTIGNPPSKKQLLNLKKLMNSSYYGATPLSPWDPVKTYNVSIKPNKTQFDKILDQIKADPDHLRDMTLKNITFSSNQAKQIIDIVLREKKELSYRNAVGFVQFASIKYTKSLLNTLLNLLLDYFKYFENNNESLNQSDLMSPEYIIDPFIRGYDEKIITSSELKKYVIKIRDNYPKDNLFIIDNSRLLIALQDDPEFIENNLTMFTPRDLISFATNIRYNEKTYNYIKEALIEMCQWQFLSIFPKSFIECANIHIDFDMDTMVLFESVKDKGEEN